MNIFWLVFFLFPVRFKCKKIKPDGFYLINTGGLMRIKLTLNSENTPFLVPFNYQPILQAVIYKVISKIDREYSKNLHQNGYWNAIDGKHYKMFVFSDLLLGKRQAQPPYLCVYNHQIEWLLSSPMSEFLQNIVNGLFKIPVIRIEKCMFHIEHVETLAEPNFSSIMKFKCLSPITVSTKENNNGKIHIKYVTPDEEDLFSAIINENLRNKYKRYKAEEPGERNVTFTFDKDYITKKIIGYRG
ncbi:MAG: CRISPR-associated endoribonuclease Cas6 [Calditrichaeota bacterium]|nr:MAG: CRISPR-associated endoribonuclease Cas6 [Calditrichota bacterium]